MDTFPAHPGVICPVSPLTCTRCGSHLLPLDATTLFCIDCRAVSVRPVPRPGIVFVAVLTMADGRHLESTAFADPVVAWLIGQHSARNADVLGYSVEERPASQAINPE